MSIKNKKSKRITLESLEFPSYEEVTADIKKKVGKKPPLPKTCHKGKWTDQSLKVLTERYLLRDGNGKIIETPAEMCWRVSWDIASAEARWGKTRKDVAKLARVFYDLLISKKFLPNSPTLMNAGAEKMLQYSGCYVLPIEDSLEGIFDAIKHQALIHQAGGGTGFSFGKLRPKGSIVRSSGGVASGPVSFMRIFDAATNEIKQGGKRRGANMGILRVDHPDILEFISCKNEGGITNFNISVAITDKFMKAYEKNEEYDLINPMDGKKAGSLDAKDVFDTIAKNAWRTGDPGLVFIDKINKGSANPVPLLGPVEATNPCGEQPLYPYDSCNLGSVYLPYFIKEQGAGREIDWEELKSTVRLAIHFMDNVIEMNPYPLEKVRQTTLAIRRIGLGLGGWADLLIGLEIPYDSEEALKLARKVMKIIKTQTVVKSEELAKEKGYFPLWPVSIYKNQNPRRNSTLTTIAPTGTTSIIAGASSGIEPLFAIAYQHVVKDKSLDRTLTFINPALQEVGERMGFWTGKVEKMVKERGTVGHIKEIPEEIRKIFVTAHDIEYEWHIKMQEAFQGNTDNAVSKTVNMESSASVEDVKNAYMLAWKTDCKGVTVFRDGCKDVQVLNLGVKDDKGEDIKPKIWMRPMQVSGSTYKIKTPVGTAFITVNHDENENPIEVFINIGKAGSDVQAMAEALGRVISKSLKFGNNLTAKERAVGMIDQLKGIGGRRSVGFGPNKILSLPDAVAIALSTHFGFKINGNGIEKEGKNEQREVISNGEVKVTNDILTDVKDGVIGQEKAKTVDLSMLQKLDSREPTGQTQSVVEAKASDICPSCGGSSLIYQEGCVKCFACGHSEC